MPLIVIVGPRGSGKNAFLVRYFHKIKSNGRPIFSNFFFSHPNYNPVNLIRIMELPKSIELILDEAYVWLESRTSMKYINIFLTYIVFQLRKTDTNIFITAQDLSTVDIRFRNQYDYIIECERQEEDFTYHIKKKKMFIDPSGMIDYELISLGKYLVEYDEMKNYFEMYDTNEIIKIPAKSRMEFEILKTEPNLLLDKALEIIEIIKDNISNITQDSIMYTLLLNKIDISWYKIIYLLMKNYIIEKK